MFPHRFQFYQLLNTPIPATITRFHNDDADAAISRSPGSPGRASPPLAQALLPVRSC